MIKVLIILVMMILVLLQSSNASPNYKVFDSITANALGNKELDHFANCYIESYEYNETTNTIIFKIENKNRYNITATVWDVYAKKKYELTIEPGIHYYNFSNVHLRYGRFFFAFIKGDEFALVNGNVQIMTLPDEIYIVSKNAINWFSYKKALFCLGLFMIGVITTKEYLIKKLLYFRVKEAKLFLLASFMIFSVLLLWYNYGSDYKSWDVRYLFSYYNWFYYVFIILGYIVGFKLFSPELRRFVYFDFKNWTVKLIRLPCVKEQDFLRVRWLDGRYYIMNTQESNEFGFYDALYDDDGKIQIITDYDVYKEEIKTDYEGFWKSLLAKLDKFIYDVKSRFGKVIGAISVDMSCIMNKNIAECVFLNDSLESLNAKLYELYYEIMRLKNVRGVEVIDVSQTAMDIITRDITPEMSDITFRSIKDMIEDESGKLKHDDIESDDNDSSGEKDGIEGTNEPDN